jgi:hypothetical protein
MPRLLYCRRNYPRYPDGPYSGEEKKISFLSQESKPGLSSPQRSHYTVVLAVYTVCMLTLLVVLARYVLQNKGSTFRKCMFYLSLAQQPPVGHGLLIFEASRSHSDKTHSVGILWTSDQPEVETSTWQHPTLTTDRQTSMPPMGFESAIAEVAADPRLRQHILWGRANICICDVNYAIKPEKGN